MHDDLAILDKNNSTHQIQSYRLCTPSRFKDIDPPPRNIVGGEGGSDDHVLKTAKAYICVALNRS